MRKIGTPLSHVSGHFAALMALFSGQTVVLMPGPSFEAGHALNVLGQENVTGLAQAARAEASPVGSYA